MDLHIAMIYESLPMVQSYDTVVNAMNAACNVKKKHHSTKKRMKEKKIRGGRSATNVVMVDPAKEKERMRQ